MRLKIKKLFFKYDYDLTFDNKINILVGENGCGKTTILKILNCILNQDFCSLSKIKFEKITYIDNDNKETNIYYDELQPSKASNNPNYMIFLTKFLKNYDYVTDYNHDHSEFDFDNFYNKFMEASKFLEIDEDRCPYSRYNQNEYVNKIMYILFDCDFDVYSDAFMFGETHIGLLLTHIENVPFGSKIFLYDLYTYYCLYNYEKYPGEIEKKADRWRQFSDNSNKMLVKYITSWIKVYDNNYIQFDLYRYYNFLNKPTLFNRCSSLHNFVKFKDNNEYKLDKIDNKKMEDILTKLCDCLYEKNEHPGEIHEENYVFRNLTLVKRLFVYINYYLDDIVKHKNSIEVDDKYLMFEHKYEDAKKRYLDELDYNKFISAKNEEDIEEFKSLINESIQSPLNLIKTIVKNCIFRYDKGIMDLQIEPNYQVNYGDYDFLNIENLVKYLYVNVENLLNEIEPDNLKKFRTMTKNYFTNKIISFSYEYDKDKEDNEYNGVVSIIDKKTNICLSEQQLSSGEQKMLRIIKLLTLNDPDSVLLLDEPDLSMSLYWQGRLIEDIENYTTSKCVIITTQSPDLFNEDQIKYAIEVQKEVIE